MRYPYSLSQYAKKSYLTLTHCVSFIYECITFSSAEAPPGGTLRFHEELQELEVEFTGICDAEDASMFSCLKSSSLKLQKSAKVQVSH